MGVLTAENKKHLNTYAKYMMALGTKTHSMTFWYFDLDSSTIENSLNRMERLEFDNGRSTDVPIFLRNILFKIAIHVDKQEYFNLDFCQTDDDDPGTSLTIRINYVTKEISVELSCHYTGESDESNFADLTDDNENIIQELKELFPNDEELVLNYNGGGDSGFIDDTFSNRESVPASVEDFCYRELENNFGGWEINEGSYGNFTFNLSEDSSITLNHTMMVEKEDSVTVFEEKF